jgi:hypothetical protein
MDDKVYISLLEERIEDWKRMSDKWQKLHAEAMEIIKDYQNIIYKMNPII